MGSKSKWIFTERLLSLEEGTKKISSDWIFSFCLFFQWFSDITAETHKFEISINWQLIEFSPVAYLPLEIGKIMIDWQWILFLKSVEIGWIQTEDKQILFSAGLNSEASKLSAVYIISRYQSDSYRSDEYSRFHSCRAISK